MRAIAVTIAERFASLARVELSSRARAVNRDRPSPSTAFRASASTSAVGHISRLASRPSPPMTGRAADFLAFCQGRVAPGRGPTADRLLGHVTSEPKFKLEPHR